MEGWLEDITRVVKRPEGGESGSTSFALGKRQFYSSFGFLFQESDGGGGLQRGVFRVQLVSSVLDCVAQKEWGLG